jgi:hypothetical protein
MVRTHYPPYIKTVLKAGAVFHLLFSAQCIMTGISRSRELWKNSKTKRKLSRASRFENHLQTRDEHIREVVRPALDWQPNSVLSEAPGRFSKIFF